MFKQFSIDKPMFSVNLSHLDLDTSHRKTLFFPNPVIQDKLISRFDYCIFDKSITNYQGRKFALNYRLLIQEQYTSNHKPI